MTDEEISLSLIRAIDANLKKWRTWFPSERSSVEVPRQDLIALRNMAARAINERDLRPITGEWLVQIGFTEDVLSLPTYQDYFIEDSDRIDIRIYEDGEMHMQINRTEIEWPPVTRGTLISLLRALDIHYDAKTLYEG
jgi:hypothetical protein